MRPRGFIALPGDVFGDDEDAAPRRSWRELLRQPVVWIGWCSAIACWTLCNAVDALIEARWGSAAISFTCSAWMTWMVYDKWRDWRRHVEGR